MCNIVTCGHGRTLTLTHTALDLTQDGVKNHKHPVSSRSVGGNILVLREDRRERSDWLKLRGTQLNSNNHSLQPRWAEKHFRTHNLPNLGADGLQEQKFTLGSNNRNLDRSLEKDQVKDKNRPTSQSEHELEQVGLILVIPVSVWNKAASMHFWVQSLLKYNKNTRHNRQCSFWPEF